MLYDMVNIYFYCYMYYTKDGIIKSGLWERLAELQAENHYLYLCLTTNAISWSSRCCIRIVVAALDCEHTVPHSRCEGTQLIACWVTYQTAPSSERRGQNRRGRWSKSVWRNRSTCFAGTKRAAGRVLVFFKTSFVFDPLGPHYQTRFLLHKLIARRDAKTDFNAGYLNWKHVTKTQTKCIGL